MAGFSLGGGGSHTQRGEDDGDDQHIAPESLFLYGAAGTSNTPTNTTRGFELWQQQQQQIQRHHQHQFYSAAPTMLGFSSNEPQHQLAGPSSGASRMRGSSSGGGGGMSCQDCGNQSKKDCAHMRCRTCCKSRGFQCPTHIKSTWVPASKRRERQQQLAAAVPQPSSSQHRRSISEGSKRPRELSARLPTAIATTATTTSGGMEAGNFPSEVSSPAVFRCVRVSQLDEGEEEYAYQTAVSIGGHMFRGILYDHGPDQAQYHGEPSSTAATAAADITTASASARTAAVTGSAGMMDPSSVYPTPLSAFMAGTQFFPHHPRP